MYAPTYDNSDKEVERFYDELEEVVKLVKKGEISMIIRDFNSNVGLGADGEVVGQYGLDLRNDRSDGLVKFGIENDLFISNTFFKLPPKWLYTSKSPGDRTKNKTGRKL